MNKLAVPVAILALLILGQPKASAIIVVSSDFPMEGVATDLGQASTQSQLSDLAALYDNDVALLLNPDEAYSKTIKEALPDPATKDELRRRALASSGELTLQSLASAVSEMVKAAPQNAHLIMASAIAMLSDLPGGDSLDNRITLAQTALLAISPKLKNDADYAALVIGVTAQGQKPNEVAETVIALRDFATSGAPDNEQTGRIRALDQSLVAEGILRPTMATPEFITFTRDYKSSVPPTETGSTDDQGGGFTTGGPIGYGSFGGFGGSSGGSGDPGFNPTPNPTPVPTPVPTPTPAPTPVS